MINLKHISVLISTMNRSSLEFLDQMFPYQQWQTLNLVVINQSVSKKIKSSFQNIKVVNTHQFGLSNSRNMALKHCHTTYGIIADDDVVFQEHAFDDLIKSITKKPDAVAFCFMSLNEQLKHRKSYPTHHFQLSLPLKNYKPSSIELVFNVALLHQYQLQFDEHFGLGAAFPLGEEEVLIVALLKQNLPVYFWPYALVMHQGLSTGQVKSNLNYLKTKAVLYFINHGNLVYVWLLKFSFYIWRKELQPRSNIIKTITSLYQAIKTYKSLKSS